MIRFGSGHRLNPQQIRRADENTRKMRLQCKTANRVHVAVVSDLHAGNVHADYVRKTAAEVHRSNPDILIIAGDVVQNGLTKDYSEKEDGPEIYRQTLKDFSGRWHTAVLVGNHDLWGRRPNGPSSQELWEDVLPRVTREAGAIWLETEPLVVQGVRLAIAGTIGWYDYLAYPGRTEEAIAEAKKGPHGIADADHIDWAWSDPEFAAGRRESLRTTLESLSGRKDVDRILVVTHVPPFMELQSPEARERANNPKTMAYEQDISAYRFAPGLGALICRYPKVTHVVAGHNHFGVQTLIQRPGLAPPKHAPIDARVVDADAEGGRQIVHYTFST